LPFDVSQPAKSREANKSAALLVVEDDYLIGSLLSDQLKDLGYSVVGPAFNLEDASRFAFEAPIDGALLDINLGGTGPSGTVAEILASRQIPFLFVSGYRRAPEGRFRRVAILSKPFTIERLRIAVEEMLRVV
jgi:DNA-binding response OmpR family regulator